MSTNATITHRLTFDLICCKKCAPAHTRGLATFLEIEPAAGVDASKRIYAYVDWRGRAWRTTAKAMAWYVRAQRRRFQKYAGYSERWRRTWPGRWNAVSLLVHGEVFSKATGQVQSRPRCRYRSAWAWHALKGKGKGSLGLAVGHAYRIRVASAMPYILIGSGDDAGHDFLPFARDTKAFGGCGADVDGGQVVKIGNGKQTIKLAVDHGTAFELFLRSLYAYHLQHAVYTKTLWPILHGQQTAREMQRVFELNALRTPAVKTAITAAKGAIEHLTAQGKALKDVEFDRVRKQAAKVVWSWLKPPARGKPSRADRHWEASWHKHEGGYGPLFALGYALYLLKETHLAKNVFDSLLKDRVFALQRTFETRFRLQKKSDPFLGLDAVEPASKDGCWLASASGWLHKGLTIAVDSMCWYMTRQMKVAIEQGSALADRYGGMVTLSKRVLSPKAFQRVRGVMESKVPHLKLLAKKARINFRLGGKTYPDTADDLFAWLEELGKVGKRTKELAALEKKLARRAVRDVRDLHRLSKLHDELKHLREATDEFRLGYERGCQAIQETFAGEFTTASKLKSWAHWLSSARLLCSVYFCYALLRGDLDRAIDGGWTFWEACRFGVSLIGNGAGLTADVYAAFPDGLLRGLTTLGGTEATSEATSFSRAVGASRVFGLVAASAMLLVSAYDFERARREGDVRGMWSNGFVAFGSALMLAGLALDGSGVFAPIGIALNVAGMVCVAIGGLIEVFRPQASEAESYLKALLKQVKGFKILDDNHARDQLVAAVEERASYATIPVTAFIVLPKARVRIVNRYPLFGEPVKVEVETFRLPKGHKVDLILNSSVYAERVQYLGGHRYGRYMTPSEIFLQRIPLKVRGGALPVELDTGNLWEVDASVLKKCRSKTCHKSDMPWHLKLGVQGKFRVNGEATPLLSNATQQEDVLVQRPSDVLKARKALWSASPDGGRPISLNRSVGFKYRKKGSAYVVSKTAHMVAKVDAKKDVLRRLVRSPGLKVQFWSTTGGTCWVSDQKQIYDEEVRNNYLQFGYGSDHLTELIKNTRKAKKQFKVDFKAELKFYTRKAGILVDTIAWDASDTQYLWIERDGAA